MEITFYGSLPPIQSAINISGNNEGARIKLDIPQTDVEAIKNLVGFSEKLLKITVEVEDA